MIQNPHTMRPTPSHIKAIIAQQGYGGVERAIKATYWDLYRLGYNTKEMKETMSRDFGTEDQIIRAFIYFALND